jgi:hypothetical protein
MQRVMNYFALFFMFIASFIFSNQSYQPSAYETLYENINLLSIAIQEARLEEVKKYDRFINTYLPRQVDFYDPVPGDNAICLATRLYIQNKGRKKTDLKKIILYLYSKGSDPFFQNHKHETAFAIASEYKKITLCLLFKRYKTKK